MKTISKQNTRQLPLQLVCSSKFGVDAKISIEQVWNMYESDGFMVNFPGYKEIAQFSGTTQGRGIFVSTAGGFILLVLDNRVYRYGGSLVGTVNTYAGDVFIEENNAHQIAICDKEAIYIYNYKDNTFIKATTSFTPIHLSQQNGYFIAVAKDTFEWRLSALNNGLSWTDDATVIGEFEIGGEFPVATMPLPTMQNQLLIFGSNNTVIFSDLADGGSFGLFPYARNNSVKINYGCVNPATIAAADNYVVWLGQNKSSGLAIMVTTGGQPEKISSDGIDLRLGRLQAPQDSTASLFRIDGHLFYLINFYNPADNFSLIYDFNTQKFFNISDNKQNYHPARKIVSFENSLYFLSHAKGSLYQLSTNYYSYAGEEAPRIIITPYLRMPDTMPFIVQNLFFPIEQGSASEDRAIDSRVDLAFSTNGGKSFGNYVSRTLNPEGKSRNIVSYWNLGRHNELAMQFRFYGLYKFIVGNGQMSIMQ